MIQEYVPGKQVTLAHLIANPGKDLFKKLGLPDAVSAIGILTITPSGHRQPMGEIEPAGSLRVTGVETGCMGHFTHMISPINPTRTT